MLQSIREKAQGWFAWLIVIMISVPFALWGIQSYIGGGSASIKASVNDREISEQEFENDYHKFRAQLRQNMGSAYRPDLLDEKLLRKELLASVIKSELIYQQAMQLGMRTSDEILREIIKTTPVFQVGGIFNNDAYENVARSMGLTTEGLESQLRQQLVSEQLTRAISGSEIVTQKEFDELLRLKDQRRKLIYMTIPAANHLAAVEVTPEQIEEYYNANKQTLMSPERVKLEYLDLDIGNIAKTVQVGDEELRAYYEQNKDNYVVPEERRASHILIAVDGSAEADAKALAAAEAALQRIRSGEKFASVAKAVSQDPGSASAGGDLGFFGKGIMTPEFEKAVFGLEKGAISDLVKTQFGYHIIKLTDIKPKHGRGFEEVKGELAEAYRKEEAERLFSEYANKLDNMAFEDPDSLEPAADALGLKVQKSDWIGRNGGAGVLGNGSVITAAFSEDVLVEHHNSEVLELGQEHVLVLRVAEHEEPQIRPLEQVRSEIETILKQRAASKLAEQEGKEIIAELKQGGSLDKVASVHKVKLNPEVEVARDSKKLPDEVLETLFKMPRPEGAGQVYGEVALADGDYTVLALQQVIDGSGEGLTDDDKSKLQASMERIIGESSFDHLVENMRDRSDVVITEEKE